MKIREIRAAPVDLTPWPTTVSRVPHQATDGFVSPMRRYNQYRRADWNAHWKRAAVVVTAILFKASRDRAMLATCLVEFGSRTACLTGRLGSSLTPPRVEVETTDLAPAAQSLADDVIRDRTLCHSATRSGAAGNVWQSGKLQRSPTWRKTDWI